MARGKGSDEADSAKMGAAALKRDEKTVAEEAAKVPKDDDGQYIIP